METENKSNTSSKETNSNTNNVKREKSLSKGSHTNSKYSKKSTSDVVVNIESNINRRKNSKCVEVVSNFKRILMNNYNVKVREYSINVLPELEPNSNILAAILKNLHPEIYKKYGKYFLIGLSIYSNSEIDDVIYSASFNDMAYEIKISPTENILGKTMNFSQHKDPKLAEQAKIQYKMFYEKFINAVLRSNPQLKKLGKKCVFDLFKVSIINNGAMASFPGYSFSTLISNDLGPLLRINTKSKVVYNKSCLEEIKSMTQQSEIKEYFIGYSVIANYGNKNIHRIDDVVFDTSVDEVFISYRKSTTETESINLTTYFYKNYNKNIQDKNQPLFVKYVDKNGKKESVYLIPELCMSTRIGDKLTKNDGFGKNISRTTKMKPREKMDKFDEFGKYLETTTSTGKNQSSSQMCKDWGFTLSKEFISINARQLDPPRLIFAGDKKVDINGGKFRSESCLSPDVISSWAYICERDDNSVGGILDKMQNACRKLGLTLPRPKALAYGNSKDWTERIRTDRNRLKELSIVVVMLPNNYANTYKQVKKLMYSEVGVPCQCLVISKHSGSNLSSITNVLNQMIVKCNGSLYKMELGQVSAALKTISTIIGIEVTKQGHNLRYTCTATTDKFHSKLLTEDYLKTSNDKDYYPINAFIEKVVNYFKTTFAKKPITIIIYRNGVNMYQTRKIYEEEAMPIKVLFENLSKQEDNYQPGYLFIMTNKLSDIKFFEKKPGNNIDNPGSGLCVDSCVTPGAYEFYIQPQYVNCGTATPTKFQVLLDTTKMCIEEMQEISYHLCYYYWNWSGAIRVPSVLKFSEVCYKFSKLALEDKGEEVLVKKEIKNSPFFI